MTRTRRLSVAERLAAADKATTLADIVARTPDWDRLVVEQAVYAVGLAADEFSANSLRDVLPDVAHGYLGAALSALHNGQVIEPTGEWVPSTSGPTKGHRIAVWRLTARGRHLADQPPATTLEAA